MTAAACISLLALSVLRAEEEEEPVEIPAGPAKQVTAEEVERAIRKGIAAVRQNMRVYRNGFGGNLGSYALSVMALLNAGVPSDDPAVAEAIASIVKSARSATGDNYQGVYNAGLVNTLLGMLRDPKYDSIARTMSIRLRSFQAPNGGWGDYSRTQFALLGLKAAEDLGVAGEARSFTSARTFLEGGQNRDGSWGYTQKTGSGYGSMTAAGITGLFIVNEQAAKNSMVCGANGSDPQLKQAMKWLGDRFTVRGNPLAGRWHYYYLYALERIGVLTSQKYIGGHDWYREGAAYLVGQQNADGTWNAAEPLSTEFALLFLGKGNTPVVAQKLQYGDDWNPDPYDIKDVVAQASRDLKTAMATQVVDVNATAKDLAAAPILYLQGRKAFTFAPVLRESIKAFVDQGGFVVASACCGADAFDKSLREEMKIMFPDAAFEVLPEDHDIYSVRHKIVHKNAFMIEGLNTGCRTAILYAPHDICCAWSGCKGCLDKMSLAGVEAKNLGVNIIAYAVGFQHLRKKLEEVEVNPGARKETTGAKRNALVIGQIYHSGDWNPDPAAIGNLTKTLQDQTAMKGEVGKKMVALGSDDLGDYAVLYLTGHKKFQFTAAQIEELRAYLNRGGYLVADACCGKAEFDVAFRKLCEDLYPQRKLTRLPPTHGIFQEPYQIKTIGYKPAVKALFPAVGDQPYMEGITAPDGRLQIAYSRFNFGCELQGHSCANCLGIKAEDAYRIAVNAIMYGLSH